MSTPGVSASRPSFLPSQSSPRSSHSSHSSHSHDQPSHAPSSSPTVTHHRSSSFTSSRPSSSPSLPVLSHQPPSHGYPSADVSKPFPPATASASTASARHHRPSSSSHRPSSTSPHSSSPHTSSPHSSSPPHLRRPFLPTAPLPPPIPSPLPSPSLPPPPPQDADSLAAALRLRKLQYMQTFIHSDPTPALILPRLYLGSIGAQKNLPFLLSHRISHVLTIGNHLPIFHPTRFHYLHLVVQDGEREDIRKHFTRCLAFVERGRGGLGEVTGAVTAPPPGEEEKGEGGPLSSSPPSSPAERRHDGEGKEVGTGVLLHCFAGRSRSVTILLAYLLTLVHRNPASHPDVQLMMEALGGGDGGAGETKGERGGKEGAGGTGGHAPLSLARLFDFVKAKRPEVKPNAGFVAQLLLLEKELTGVNERFAEMSVKEGGGREEEEVGKAVVKVGQVQDAVVRREEREQEAVVLDLAGKERGEEWRQF